MLDFAVLAAQEIDPKGNQSIGWLAGIFTMILVIAIVLLLWSFTKMAKKAREPWPDEESGPGDAGKPPRT